MDSTLNYYKSNPKINWNFNKYHIFSSPKRSRNVLYKRFMIVSLLTFMVLIVLRANFLFYYEQFFTEGEQLGWEKHVNRSVPHYILPNERTTILEPSTLCKDDQPILLLMVIFSKPDNFAHRQTLRRTWANTTEFNYSKFSKMHAHLKGSYLEINNPGWMKFIKKNSNITNPVNVKDKIEDSEVVVDYSQLDFHVRTAFLIGYTENEELQYEIHEESKIYDDIIQERFLDTYNNLTLKTSMLMKWTNNNCLDKVKFAMKVDEDNFLNVPNLIHYLLGGTVPFYDATLNRHKDQNNQNVMDTLDSKNRLTQHENLLVGSLLCHIKPCTLLNDKWFAPKYMYDGFVYPNFLAGGSGFVFTMDTAAKLYNASMEVPLFTFEDVYMTGLCAEKAGIRPWNFHLFNNDFHVDMCDFKGLITQHQVKPRVQKLAYDFILNSNSKCVGPSPNAVLGLLNDTNQYCGNKYTFGYPKEICATRFYKLHFGKSIPI